MVAWAGCLPMPLLRHHLAPFSAKLFAINSSRIPPQPKPPSGAKSGLKDRGIRVNVVSPGFTDTPGLSKLLASGETGQERFKMISNIVPLGPLGTPDDIGKSVEFLASDDSSYITRTELFVDGGVAQV